MIDDHRILGIVKPVEAGNEPLLVLWDTSGPHPLQRVFEMPLNKTDTAHVPERLMSSASMQNKIGLHRADPNQRIVGVVCQRSYDDIGPGNDYTIIISAADLCVHASTQATGEPRIRWEKWQPSTTVVRDKLVTACTLGSRFFVIARLPYALYATRLRIYDFSPGARGRRYPDRSSVLNLDIHVGHLVGRAAAKDWDFSEDNLLIFRVSAGFPNPRILRVTV